MATSPATLDPERRRMVERLLEALGAVDEIVAVVLGGSRARGRATPESDTDLGLLYRESRPIVANELRSALAEVPGCEIHALTEPWEWGSWVNGGAWLSVEGERVDLLYRCIEHVGRVIDASERGEFEIDFGQQPPFGFFGPTYLGEVDVAAPLRDPRGVLADLKERVVRYPEALRAAVVERLMWSIEFTLTAFASKAARRGDAYLTAANLGRCVHALTLVLFALNRRYYLNDKTALDEIESFESRPDRLRERVADVFASPGTSSAELGTSLAVVRGLFDETRALAGDLYRPRFSLG